MLLLLALGIDAMRVVAQTEIVDEWWLKVETTADVVGCSACGTRAVGHGRRKTRIRDLPVFGRRSVLFVGEADLALHLLRRRAQDRVAPGARQSG